jgi:chorismate mutase
MQIEKIRGKIDGVDGKIVKMLNKRAKLALQISREKQKESKTIKDNSRERYVKKHLILQNEGPLDNISVLRIVNLILLPN